MRKGPQSRSVVAPPEPAPAGAPVPPLRADARRNRERLLEVARALFSEQGLAVGIDEIAQRAGVGVGTFYRHFPTKEALFQEIVPLYLGALISDARGWAAAPDPGKAFFAFLARFVEEGVTKTAMMGLLTQSGVATVCASTPSQPEELRAALKVLLTRAQKAGAVRDDVGVPEVIALVCGAVVAVERHDGDVRSRGRLFDVLRDGLRPRGR